MDVLSRIKDLLGGKKRKSSIIEHELETSKRIRMSDLNGDFDSEPYINNEFPYESTVTSRNHSRRSDSYLKNSLKSSIPPSMNYNHANEQDGGDSTYFNNGADKKYSDFKQPMPPKTTNGTIRKVPALLSATRAHDRIMFNRGSNQPQQTVTPLYNRFGEPNELAHFRYLPNLQLVKNRSNVNDSIFLPRDSLVNGHEHSLFASSRMGNSLNQPSERSLMSTQSICSSTPSGFKSNRSFLDSTNRSNSTMSLKNNSIFTATRHPPQNLSRTRYQSLLDMIPGFRTLHKLKKPALIQTKKAIVFNETDGDGDTKSHETSSSSSTTPNVDRVNSLKTRLETKDVFKDDWQQRLNEKYSAKSLGRRDSLKQMREEADECERKSRDTEDRLKESFTKITISTIVPEDEEEEEPANDYPQLDQDKQRRIVQWVCARDTGTMLINKFNLQISRHDIQTLQWNPLTWLNDGAERMKNCPKIMQ